MNKSVLLSVVENDECHNFGEISQQCWQRGDKKKQMKESGGSHSFVRAERGYRL